ncbi:MAG: amidohydrolase [Clostridiales bacterium]|nr:amidohydrolase [Clostridiales bacterium]
MKIICTNGRIHTMDSARTVAEAIGMEDGIITVVGSNEEVKARIAQPDRAIDLEGKAMLPGFFDGHMHLLSYGYSKSMAYLDDCKSIEDLVQSVNDHILEHELPAGTWVEGRGWNEEAYPEKRLPNRHDLDRVSADHMIVLGRSCSFSCVVNTRTLRELDLYDNPPRPESGMVEMGSDGHPTGIFVGEATHLIYSRMPRLGVAGIKKSILTACRDYVKAGITSVDTDDFELTRAGTFREILQAFFELDAEENLPIRIREMLFLPTRELLEDFLTLGYKTGDGSPFFRIGSFKMLTDGSLGTRQAALMEPYADDPLAMGAVIQSQAELSVLMRRAFESGLDLVGDGMGDRGIYMLLKAYEPLVKENPGRDLRFCIDHSQITTEGIIEEYKRLNLMGGCELVFVASDIDIVEERVGAHRASLSYNWKRFYDQGVIVTAGSDSPVEHYDPILGIHASVNRHNWEGKPEGGWLPEQRLTVDQAVSALTVGSAYAAREEAVKGTLEVGKYADAVVLSEDIFAMNPAHINQARAVMTIVAGQVAYED